MSVMKWEMMKSRKLLLEAETFAAATSAFDVGIVENEFGRQLIFHKVHLCSQQRQLRLSIDKHLHAVLNDFFVEFGFFWRLGEDLYRQMFSFLP